MHEPKEFASYGNSAVAARNFRLQRPTPLNEEARNAQDTREFLFLEEI